MSRARFLMWTFGIMAGFVVGLLGTLYGWPAGALGFLICVLMFLWAIVSVEVDRERGERW